MPPYRLLLPLTTLLVAVGITGCGGDSADPTSGASTTPTAATTPSAPEPSQAPAPAGTPNAWLGAVCPGGTFTSGEITPDGRGGPKARNEAWTCAAVPQDDATVYRTIELFSYDADPTAYWTKQAGRPGDDVFVYFAVKQTDTGWFVFVEDDSRTAIGAPIIAASGDLGFTLHLDG